jgi:hypothetical protein
MNQEKIRFDDLLKPKKRVDYLDQLEKRRQHIRKGDKDTVAELVETYHLEIPNWAQTCLEIGKMFLSPILFIIVIIKIIIFLNF